MKITSSVLCMAMVACGEQSVKVVNTAPNVSILTPSDNAVFVLGDVVNFTAVVNDSQQGAETLDILWNSDLDGELNTESATGSGEVMFTTINLSVGNHLITLRAIDAKAEVGEDQVIVGIGEPAPETDDTQGKSGGVFCSAGGSVSGNNISGSYCMGPVDIAPGNTSTSGNLTWQPGPVVKISP